MSEFVTLPRKLVLDMVNAVYNISAEGGISGYAHAEICADKLDDALGDKANDAIIYVMADGKTKLLDYLAAFTPEDQCGDEWTAGYEQCRQRLYRILVEQNRIESINQGERVAV